MITVGVVDDHPIVEPVCRAVLGGARAIRALAEATCGQEAAGEAGYAFTNQRKESLLKHLLQKRNKFLR
jgi:hypothetical protein